MRIHWIRREFNGQQDEGNKFDIIYTCEKKMPNCRS